MGEWKAQLSLRVRQDLRREMEELAARERRTLGNLGEILVSWAVEQLREAGSTEKLFSGKFLCRGSRMGITDDSLLRSKGRENKMPLEKLRFARTFRAME